MQNISRCSDVVCCVLQDPVGRLVPLVSRASLASPATQDLPVLLVARASSVQLDSPVYQEVRAIPGSKASVDWTAYKVLRELVGRLVLLASLDSKDLQETPALLVHRHAFSRLSSYLHQFIVFHTFRSGLQNVKICQQV